MAFLFSRGVKRPGTRVCLCEISKFETATERSQEGLFTGWEKIKFLIIFQVVSSIVPWTPGLKASPFCLCQVATAPTNADPYNVFPDCPVAARRRSLICP